MSMLHSLSIPHFGINIHVNNTTKADIMTTCHTHYSGAEITGRLSGEVGIKSPTPNTFHDHVPDNGSILIVNRFEV